ncbi:MAG: reactive intermediate/imine deaminase [Planctomycetota bacterium]|nr:MAG: reactive intermediate/imine deaminase [Planctomycetota bacterium]
MSRLEVIATTGAPAAIGPYSQAIVHGDTVFTSGQIGMTPETGELVSGGVEAEARQALSNLEAVLREAGSGMQRVVKTTVFLLDMADFAAVNALYAEAFGEARPARSTVAVSQLPKGARFEIDAVAARP